MLRLPFVRARSGHVRTQELGIFFCKWLVFAGSQVRDVRCEVLLWNEKVFHWNVSRIHDGLMCHFVCMLLLHSLLLLRALEVLLFNQPYKNTCVQAGSMHREDFVPDNSPVQQAKSVRQTGLISSGLRVKCHSVLFIWSGVRAASIVKT